MKSILFSLLLFAFPAFAQQQVWMMVAGQQEEAPNEAVSPYLLEEGFEGAGYENTWYRNAGAGTLDPDYTTAIDGSQSLQITFSANYAAITNIFSRELTNAYVYFKVRVAVGITAEIVKLLNAPGQTVGIAEMRTSGAWLPRNGETGSATETVTKMALDGSTVYHVWFFWSKGTGANGIATIAFSTDGSRPTSGDAFRSVTNGTSTTDAAAIMLGIARGNTTLSMGLDSLKVSETEWPSPVL